GPSLTVATGNLTLGAHSVAVVVSGPCGSVTNNASLTVNELTSATALSDLTVCQGTVASFSTTARGTGLFNYQWTLDGAPVGTNGPILTLDTASVSVGEHAVGLSVTGQCGSAITGA